MLTTHIRRSVKFSLSTRSPDFLRRPRLLDFIQAHIHRNLVLVSAAAGYGKSSLLSDFAHATDLPAAWCSLDETDQDLVALATDLSLALQSRFPAFRSTVAMLAPQSRTNAQELATMLVHDIEASLGEYFVLILDDFHLVEDSAPVLRFFEALLAHLPEPAHVVIAGRTVPSLRLVSLAARQQVVGLSEEHLRFTPAEVRTLVRLRNTIDLPEIEAEKLVADTEGWITGIILTTQLMWRGSGGILLRSHRSESPLYEYLAEEVWQHQPEPLRRFLLESAVLPEMESQMCDAILDRSDSVELLRLVETRRLFVTRVGDEFRAYRYHQLFREFLIAKLRAQDPARLRTLQARAADWYNANGMVETAVTFYGLAGHFTRAAHVIESNAEATFATGRHATLRHWAELLKLQAHETPTLYLFLSKVDTDAGALTAAQAKLAIAATGFAQRGDAIGALRVDLQRSLLLYRRSEFEQAMALVQRALVRAGALNQAGLRAQALRYKGLCCFALGQLALAEESLLQAEQLLHSPRHRYDLALVLHDLALILRTGGQTTRCAHFQQKALAIWRERPAAGPLSAVLNNIGLDLHMLSQYAAALSTYEEALDWARRASSARLESIILAGQADVFVDLRDYSRATELYRQAMLIREHFNFGATCTPSARSDRSGGS